MNLLQTVLASKDREAVQSEILFNDFEGVPPVFDNFGHTFEKVTSGVTALDDAAYFEFGTSRRKRDREEPAQEQGWRSGDLFVKEESFPNLVDRRRKKAMSDHAS